MVAPKAVRVGKYVIGEKIGEGGFGVVRKGVNETTGEVVAIKIMDKAQLQLHNMTPQIKREITLLTILDHPAIVKGHEVLNSTSKLFLVMEFIDGGDMHSLLSKRERLPEDEAREFFRALVSCLQYCHGRGVSHRDLKLENLLITNDGKIKVCDFGLASVRGLRNDGNELCNTIVGTEDFSAPEIIRSVPYSGDQADMWSAGILLYVMLAGFCPFRGKDTTELFRNILRCKFAFPEHFPIKAKDIVLQLLVADPAKRASAEHILGTPWLHKQSPRSVTYGPASVISENCDETNEESKSTDSGSDASNADSVVDSEVYRKAPNTLPNLSAQNVPSALRNRRHKSLGPNMPKDLAKKIQNISKTSFGNKQPRFYNAARTIENFGALYDAMRTFGTGIVVLDRKYRFTRFEKCFIGSEAVTWLQLYLKVPREAAISAGQKMLEADVFHHVCREHDFEDAYFFYRFQEDDPLNERVLNVRQKWSLTDPKRSPVQLSHELLQKLLVICTLHQAMDESNIVDISGVQNDARFKAFCLATAELQAVDMGSIESNSEKLAFLANIYNMLWFHARLHVGSVQTEDCASIQKMLHTFEYCIGGVNLTLEYIQRVLFPMRNSNKDQKRTSSRGVNSFGSFSRLGLTSFLQSTLTSTQSSIFFKTAFEPNAMVRFVVSDGSAKTPQVRALTASEVSQKQLLAAARLYLSSVLELDDKSSPAVLLVPSFVEEVFETATVANDSANVLQWILDILGESPACKRVDLLRQSQHVNVEFFRNPGICVEDGRSGTSAIFAPSMEIDNGS